MCSRSRPSEPFSPRNHHRSEEGMLGALADIARMLGYVRVHRPAVVVVEDVDVVDVRASISAMLASIPGYTWRGGHTDPADEGWPMARGRYMWTGVRELS